jgi:hypothetical protein
MKTEPTIEQRQITQLAEAFRDKLPSEFFRDLAYCEFELARGRAVPTLVTKGGTSDVWPKLRKSILSELTELFCSNTSKYADLRRQSKLGTQTLIVAAAGYISANSGISLAVVTGAVAFTASSLLRVGISSFCRLQPPPSASRERTIPKARIVRKRK